MHVYITVPSTTCVNPPYCYTTTASKITSSPCSTGNISPAVMLSLNTSAASVQYCSSQRGDMWRELARNMMAMETGVVSFWSFDDSAYRRSLMISVGSSPINVGIARGCRMPREVITWGVSYVHPRDSMTDLQYQRPLVRGSLRVVHCRHQALGNQPVRVSLTFGAGLVSDLGHLCSKHHFGSIERGLSCDGCLRVLGNG